MKWNKFCGSFIKYSIFVIPCILVIAAAVFWVRPPVLLVTDPSFNLLYGADRARTKQIELSIKFFRRVLAISVSESAASDVVAAAVKSASSLPKIVVVQEIFASGARRYKEEMPNIPVFIVEGRIPVENRQNNAETGPAPLFLRTDTESDLLKAGIAAANLAENGDILVFQHESLSSSNKNAFYRGLETAGYRKTPLYIDIGDDFSDWNSISCVVITGPLAGFFELNLKIPVILFSWIDPGITPDNVKIIFDDSPWAAAAQWPELIKNNKNLFSSKIIFPRGRIEKKAEKIKKMIK